MSTKTSNGASAQSVSELIRADKFSEALRLLKHLEPGNDRTQLVVKIYTEFQGDFKAQPEEVLVLLTELLFMEGDLERASTVLLNFNGKESDRLSKICEEAFKRRVQEG